MHFLIVIASLIAVAFSAEEDDRAPPPFIQGAPENVIKEFWELIEKDSVKKDKEIDADITAFVAKLGGDYPKKYEDFKAQLKKGQEEFDKAHAAIVAKFSPEAKKADEEMTKIANDPELNGIQKRDKIKQIMDALPAAVREELEKAIPK